MKKTVYLLLALCLSTLTFAQGTQLHSGVPIYHLSSQIGIGTSSPSELFDINSSVDGKVGLRLENPSSGVSAYARFLIKSDQAKLQLASWSSNATASRFGLTLAGRSDVIGSGNNGLLVGTNKVTPLIFGTSDLERLRILATGEVGIGTTTPSDLLHVSKAGANTRLRVGNNSAYDQLLYFNGSADWSVGMDNSNSNAFTIASTSTLDYNQRFTIATDGKVGIGTTSPDQRLEIYEPSGAAVARIKTGLSNGVSILEFFSGSTRIGEFMAGADTKTMRFVNNLDDDDGDLVFRVKNSDEIIRVKGSGNVGIGTDSPGYKLHVNGTSRFASKMIVDDDIESKRVKVSLTSGGGWPDYVFTSSHKLKDLSEVEAYIKANGHLSNVPNAKEVEANGQDLGAIQAKLLEKIEELTLYAIKADKSTKELKSENQELKSSNKHLETQLSALLKRIEKLESKDKK